MSRYRRLFSPLRVGPLVVDNRIVFAAHLTNYAVDGRPSAQHAAYYEARAAGGVGLIITEEQSTHPTDWPYEKVIRGFRPDVVPGYRRITDAVHRHGTPILAQLNHNGPQASSMYSRLPLWGPSPLYDPLFREVPKAIDGREIAEVVAGYALVAGHCVDGGFDGVEVQCSQSSILRCFLSPATNRRDDAYGGTLERRARLLLEVVAAVRTVIGPDKVLGVRLAGDEAVEGGTTLEEAVAAARLLEAQGLTDYLNTTMGVATASLHLVEPSMAVPPGYALHLASAIREAVGLPVVGVGRIKDPSQAERALEAGHCDLVGVVRGQIADADFAAKARAGRGDDIRLCLACNQECVGRMGSNRWLGCVENPRAGREVAIPAIRRPEGRGNHVVVAGAGPAGLQAAVAAREAGRRVTVLEAADRPGGQIRLAAMAPSRAELADLIRNQLRACALLGVDIHCATPATVESVLGLGPDAVIVATGAVPTRPPWAPGSLGRVVDVTDVLTGAASPSGRVVVVDELGFHQATSVAGLLADRGCAVTVVTSAMVVGQDLDATLDLEHWNVRAAAAGITQLTDLVALGVTAGAALSLLLRHHPTGADRTVECDWVVVAVPATPAEALYFALAGCELPVERIGDCVAPRRAHAAVIEGQRAGAAL